MGPAPPDRAARLLHRETVPELDQGLNQPRRRGGAVCRLRGADRCDPRQARRDREGFVAMGRQPGQAAGHRSQGRLDRIAHPGERAQLGGRLRPALRDPREADRVPAERLSDGIAPHALGSDAS